MEKVNCKLCGKPSDPQEYENSRIREIMEEQNVCFNCALWLWHHELDQNDPNRQGRVAIIDGTHWLIGDGKGFVKGCCGTEQRIRFKDGREVVTDDLWCQGDIPEHFRHLFPDNAEFVKPN